VAISQGHLSLDAPLAPGDDTRLLDYLPDEESASLGEQMFERALTEAVDESLSTLTEREARIFRLYFGLDGGEPMTLENIGVLLRVTRERVRQLKEPVVSRFRHQSPAPGLASVLN